VCPRSSTPAQVRCHVFTRQGIETDHRFSPSEFKNKKVVIVSVPGAFTPTCSVSHIPSFIENADKLKAKGVDQVVVIAYNDAWVMSAWGKSNGIKDDWIVRVFSAQLRCLYSLTSSIS
jgi:alkyl hydroperoxide reductase 1